jgi:hypothetical protein
MARILTAYLERERVPELTALQAAIKGLKLPVALDPDYVPFETAGYLPCTLDGEDAGFDLRFKERPADLSDKPVLQSSLGARTTAMTFKWGGDPREDAAASFVCAALANDFDAVVQDGENDAVLSVDALLGRGQVGLEC